MSELQVPADVLASVTAGLDRAAAALEDTAGGSPRAVDGGEAQAELTRMLAALADNAGAVSEAMTAIGQQVGSVGAEFWSTDHEVAASYGGTDGVRAADGP